MMNRRHQRLWMVVAAIAIVVALTLMLVPQAHSGGSDAGLLILPVLFIGVIAPLRLLGILERIDPQRATDAPAYEPSFQRPPPFRLG